MPNQTINLKPMKRFVITSVIPGIELGKMGNYFAVPEGFKEYRIVAFYRDRCMIIEDWAKADCFLKVSPSEGASYMMGYFRWDYLPSPFQQGMI